MKTIILGPPGTGKTTTLLNLVDEFIKQGTKPKEIGYFSFTKKAAREAATRASEKFGLSIEHDLTYFRTLHSLAFRVLGITKDKMMSKEDYREFGMRCNIPIKTASYSDEDGIFNSDNIVNSNWYGYLMTGSAIPDPSYYDYTVSSSLFLKRTDNDILDAVYVYTTASNYFFGTKNNFTVFPTSEYTCKLDAYVYTTSASYAYTASQYNADIYLVGSAIANRNPLGLKIGTLTTNNKIAYFKDETFNFTVPLSGSIGIRIVPRSGFWEFANISMKVAEEIAFSPDEVTLIIPNENKFADTLLYKTSFYDINNNALGLDAISQPTYFTGSRQYVLRSGDTMWGRLDAQGGLTITGSTYIASGSDFYRWGNKQFNYGEWYTTASLTAPSANTPYSMSFDHTSYQSGFSIVSGSRIVAQNDGLYNLQFSAQLYNTANTTIVFSIWFAKNQTDLPNTATDVEIAKSPGTTGKRVASWNLIQYLESGSYIELRWGSDQTTGVLLGLASSSLRPAVPSLIATITQVT